MKKVILIIISAFCFLSLSSCTKKEDTTLDASGLYNQVAKDWLNLVSYEAEAYNDYKTDANHYKAYFPTEIKEETLRLNIVDVSNLLSDKYSEFSVLYASSLDLSSYQTHFISDLQAKISSRLDFLLEAEINSKWSTPLKVDEEFKNYTGAAKIKLYTVYLPIKFEAYTVSKDVPNKIIETYIICPIVYGLAFEEDTLNGVSQQITSLTEISFDTENGFLK